jgi:hypothetical protein
MIRITSPPRQIVDSVPHVVHLKTAPTVPLGPQIIRVATAAIPQPDLGPAQIFRVGTPAYPVAPNIVRVGTAKPRMEDKLAEIFRMVPLPSTSHPRLFALVSLLQRR